MGGCEHAALDDTALLPFQEDAINLAFLAWSFAAGLPGLDFSRLKLCIWVAIMYLHVIH